MLFDCRENGQSGEVEKAQNHLTYDDGTQANALAVRRWLGASVCWRLVPGLGTVRTSCVWAT
jgi:hypothetical protein